MFGLLEIRCRYSLALEMRYGLKVQIGQGSVSYARQRDKSGEQTEYKRANIT